MLVVMPIVAAVLARAFDLDPTVKIALVALALSPVPPFLPAKNIRSGGESSYLIGLLVTSALVSIVFVPLALEFLERVLDIPLSLSFWRVLLPVGLTVFAPLLVGLLVKRFAPTFAARVAKPAGRLATVLFVAGLIPLMVTSMVKAIPLIGNGTLAAMLAFSLIGLGVGHLLGGRVPGDRATLALSTAARHPGVAMAIAKVNFPEQTLVLPAVLMYILLNAIVSLGYSRWAAKRAHSSFLQ
jgi:BASS family bile acid:Na+ symporter